MASTETKLRNDASAVSCMRNEFTERTEKEGYPQLSQWLARVSNMRSRDWDCRRWRWTADTAARYRQSRSRHRVQPSLLQRAGMEKSGWSSLMDSREGKSGGTVE